LESAFSVLTTIEFLVKDDTKLVSFLIAGRIVGLLVDFVVGFVVEGFDVGFLVGGLLVGFVDGFTVVFAPVDFTVGVVDGFAVGVDATAPFDFVVVGTIDGV